MTGGMNMGKYDNPKQKKAIMALQRAFKMCEKANIQFYGCDGDLLWIDGKEATRVYDEVEVSGQDHCTSDYSNYGKYGLSDSVNTHGTYIDSGGA